VFEIGDNPSDAESNGTNSTEDVAEASDDMNQDGIVFRVKDAAAKNPFGGDKHVNSRNNEANDGDGEEDEE